MLSFRRAVPRRFIEQIANCARHVNVAAFADAANQENALHVSRQRASLLLPNAAFRQHLQDTHGQPSCGPTTVLAGVAATIATLDQLRPRPDKPTSQGALGRRRDRQTSQSPPAPALTGAPKECAQARPRGKPPRCVHDIIDKRHHAPVPIGGDRANAQLRDGQRKTMTCGCPSRSLAANQAFV